MTTRRRSVEKAYEKHRANTKPRACNFCAFHTDDGQVTREAKHFWIVKNIFGYDIWDSLDVHEHLMIVPKKHKDSLAHFSPAELKEYSELLAEYESDGYSIYSRAPQNKAKTIPHQHTHFLKLGSQTKTMYLFLRKPYLLWYR